MKILKPTIIYDHEEDVIRIVKVAKANNYYLSKNDAYNFWKSYSEKVEANWLILPEKDEILLQIILNYSDVED